jgi:hypothetical protein
MLSNANAEAAEELHFQHFSFSASSGSETHELRANCAPILVSLHPKGETKMKRFGVIIEHRLRMNH